MRRWLAIAIVAALAAFARADPCKLDEVSSAAVVSPRGELTRLDLFTQPHLSLSRKALLKLRAKGKPAKTEWLVHLGGSGAPVVTVRALANLICPGAEPTRYFARRIGVAISQALARRCAHDKDSLDCQARLARKVHISGVPANGQ